MNRIISSSLAAMTCAVAPFVAAHAEEMSISGLNTFLTTNEETTKLENGRSVVHLHQKGVSRSDDQSGQAALTPIDCFGTMVIAADGGSFEGGGSCALTDADGDTWWVAWSGGVNGGSWSVLHGDGKYAGMTGGGKWNNRLTTSDGRSVDAFTGTVVLH